MSDETRAFPFENALPPWPKLATSFAGYDLQLLGECL